MVGSEPYFAANLRSLPARDFYQWVEYCNSPAGTTSLADLRAKDGEKDPLKVRYWGVGNESWGCGGDFTAEEYAVEFRRFTSWVPGFDTRLAYIASGPSSGELNWTRGFFSKLVEKGPGMLGRVYGLALHHYTENLGFGDPAKNDWNERKGSAVEFSNAEWYEILKEADRMDGLITSHWTVMGEFDPRRRVKLVVDEWGTWYKAGTELNPSHLLGQQNTMRDVLVAGLTLDTFHRHADKVAMANIAQLVNCLQSLFLADGDKFVDHADLPRVRSLRPARRRPGGAHAGVGAGHHLPASQGHGLAPRPQRVGQREGQDAHAHGDQPARQRRPGGRDRGPRRGAGRGEGRADQRAGHPRPQHVRPARTSVGIKDATVAAVQNGVLVHRFPPASVTRLQFTLT